MPKKLRWKPVYDRLGKSLLSSDGRFHLWAAVGIKDPWTLYDKANWWTMLAPMRNTERWRSGGNRYGGYFSYHPTEAAAMAEAERRSKGKVKRGNAGL